MSDIIIYNTEDVAKKENAQLAQIKILKLIPEDNPILKQALLEFDFDNPPIDPNEFASSLVETCKLNKGIGLSANQCGFAHRVFVMGAGNDYVAFFNPVITSISDDTNHMIEGCLSFPLLGLNISRPNRISVKYQDFNGIKHEATFEGLSARCFQHEFDHMNGVVYTDRAKPLALQMGMKRRNKIAKKIKLR